METASTGSSLIVGGVCVRWWSGLVHEAEAAGMAAQINEDLARNLDVATVRQGRA